MAWTSGAGTSGVYVNSLMAMMTAVAFTPAVTTCNPTTAANWKIALHYSSGLTPGVAPINWSATSVVWANTAEVSGTGWAAGGVLLSTAAAGSTSTTPTLAEGTAGALRYDMADISVASTTLNANGGPRGCIIYCDSCTGTANYVDMMLVAVCFGGDYPTNNGTFGITWSATGIFEIDLTP